MRCSAWSSLAISVCSALLVVPTASGHVTVAPSFVRAGETATLTLTVPNERGQPMTGLAVRLTDGLRMVQGVPLLAWSSTLDYAHAVWYDGRLAPGDEATFTVRIEAWAPPGPANVLVTQRYPDGKTVEWPITLTVIPGGSVSERGWVDDTLTPPLLLFALLGTAALGLVLFLVRRKRRRSLQEK